MILAYNISDGDKNFLLQTDLDTFNPFTTNRTDKHNEIHTEISSRYTQLLHNRHTSKPYTQNLLDLNTIKSPRPKTIIRAYLIENAKQYAIGEVKAHDIPDIQRDENQSASARQQPDATELPRSTRDGNKFWEKESAKPSRIHISKTNLSIRQTTSRGVEPHLSNYANSNTNFATRIKTASSTNHVAEFPNTPAQHLDMHQTRFIKIVSTHTDTHNSNVNRTAPVEPRIKAKPILTQRTNPPCKTTTQCWRKPNSTHNLFAYITEGPMKNSLRNPKSLTQLITKTNVQAHLTRRLLKPGQNNTQCRRKFTSTHSLPTNIKDGQMETNLCDHKCPATKVIFKTKAQAPAVTSDIHKTAIQQGNTSIKTCQNNKLSPKHSHQTSTQETHYTPPVRIMRSVEIN